jgi:hypothetical protein
VRLIKDVLRKNEYCAALFIKNVYYIMVKTNPPAWPCCHKRDRNSACVPDNAVWLADSVRVGAPRNC